MTKSRVMTVLGLLGAMLALPLVAAPAAQAGVSPALISITNTGGVCSLSAGAVTGNPGSSFTVAIGTGCEVLGMDATGAPVSPSLVSRKPAGAHVTFTMGTIGSGTIVMDGFSATSQVFSAAIAVSVVDTFVPEAVLHDYLQGVGVPASGSCADVPPEAGHYPGFPIGGWSKSWARWINDGRGGPVCVRELEERPDGTVVVLR